MTDIVRCTSCGTKNRLKAAPEGQLPACGKCGTALPWLIQSADASFQADVTASIPVLADFWAEWCGPCRMIAPVLEDLSQELAGKLKIVKLNVDQNPQTATRYQARSIPMLIVFKNGEPVDTFVGAMPKGAMLQRLEPFLG